jgi:hypothetical protein
MTPEESVDHKNLAHEVAKIWGMSLSIALSMTDQQLREFARVMAQQRVHPTPDSQLDEQGFPREQEANPAEMTAQQKQDQAVRYFDRNADVLGKLGFGRRNFAEAFSEQPTRIVRRLV